MTIISKKKNWNPWENCHKNALKLFLKCLHLARIGPDILWSVNNLARSITKWTKACDKRLSRLISWHSSSEYKQYCREGNIAKQCRLGLFQDSDFAGDLEDSKSTSGGTWCVFWSHTFVPFSWMCQKQTSVSHSSTESEIISLDAGFRMDGTPALDLWDLIVALTETRIGVTKEGETCARTWFVQHLTQFKNEKKSHGNGRWFEQCWFSFFKRPFFSSESFVVYLWRQRSSHQNDHKGKKPYNETCFQNPQELLLIGCLMESMWTPKIHIKYINTKDQTRRHTDQGKYHTWWMESSFVFGSTLAISMSKRTQKDAGEERVTAKSRPILNLVSRMQRKET